MCHVRCMDLNRIPMPSLGLHGRVRTNKTLVVAVAIVYMDLKLNTLQMRLYIIPTHHTAVSQNSLCVTSKLAQITVERESGCLGLTLRGGGDFPLIVTHVRPHGPVYKTGRIKPGDRLLRLDNVSIFHELHTRKARLSSVTVCVCAQKHLTNRTWLHESLILIYIFLSLLFVFRLLLAIAHWQNFGRGPTDNQVWRSRFRLYKSHSRI